MDTNCSTKVVGITIQQEEVKEKPQQSRTIMFPKTEGEGLANGNLNGKKITHSNQTTFPEYNLQQTEVNEKPQTSRPGVLTKKEDKKILPESLKKMKIGNNHTSINKMIALSNRFSLLAEKDDEEFTEKNLHKKEIFRTNETRFNKPAKPKKKDPQKLRPMKSAKPKDHKITMGNLKEKEIAPTDQIQTVSGHQLGCQKRNLDPEKFYQKGKFKEKGFKEEGQERLLHLEFNTECVKGYKSPNGEQNGTPESQNRNLEDGKMKSPNPAISVDIFKMPHQPDKKKNFILCITDNNTKYAELIAIKNDQAETIAEAIFNSWMMRYGIPSKISFNEEKEFCNLISENFSTLLDVNATFKPFCSARDFDNVANTKMQKYLLEFFETNPFDWEVYLPALRFCYNTSYQRKIESSPYFLTYGQNAKQPVFDHHDVQQKFYGETSAEDKLNLLQLARQIANKIFEDQSELNHKIFNRQMAPHSFQKEDWVMYQGKGPYQIVQLKPHNNAILQFKSSKLCVNIEDLIAFSDFQPPNIPFSKQGGDQEVLPPKIEKERKKKTKQLIQGYKNKLGSNQDWKNDALVNELMEDSIQAGVDNYFKEEEEKEKLIQEKVFNYIWHRDHPIKLKWREIIQATPREIIEKRFPGWTDAQIINFHYSGDINGGPDDPHLISIEEAGSLPNAFYETFFPPLQIHQPAQPQPVQAQRLDQRLIGPNPFGRLFRRDENSPDPTRSTTTTEGQTRSGPPEPDGRLDQGPGDPRSDTSTATETSYDLDRSRTELRTANFEQAKNIGNLKTDETAYFHKAFDLQHKLEDIKRNKGNRKSGFHKFKNKI